MGQNLDDTDPTFVQDLRESQRAVWVVARWLCLRGHHVTVRATRVRPTVADIRDYGDAGDLEIVQRIEVKQRGLVFTSARDYPYATVFVDVAHTWDRAAPKPLAYVILNAASTHVAIVAGRTSPHWSKVTTYDRGKGRDRTFYECPVALAHFMALTS